MNIPLCIDSFSGGTKKSAHSEMLHHFSIHCFRPGLQQEEEAGEMLLPFIIHSFIHSLIHSFIILWLGAQSLRMGGKGNKGQGGEGGVVRRTRRKCRDEDEAASHLISSNSPQISNIFHSIINTYDQISNFIFLSKKWIILLPFLFGTLQTNFIVKINQFFIDVA